MPTFIYEGKAGSLRVAGRTLIVGHPTELDGRAADSAAAHAAKHPELRLIEDADKPKPASKAKSAGAGALAERQALVAKAKELGIPAKGKSADLAKAIADAEAAG